MHVVFPLWPVRTGLSRRQAVGALLTTAGMAGRSVRAQSAPEVLRVTAWPEESPTELARRFAPLGQYLEAALSLRLEWAAMPDQAALVEALVSRKVDLAWLGGFHFVLARLRTGGQWLPLVQREDDAASRSVFITRTDSDIRSLADLRGRTFSFGAVTSPAGHLMPRHALLAVGINPTTDFKRLAYSGPPDATVAAVSRGKVEAAALGQSAWDRLVAENRVDPARLRVLARTEPYADALWSVQASLPATLRARLIQALLALDPATSPGRDVLASQRATRFVAVGEDDHEALRAAAEQAGLLK